MRSRQSASKWRPPQLAIEGARVEHPVQQRAERTVGAGKIERRPDNDAICSGDLSDQFITVIIAINASERLAAATSMNKPANRCFIQLEPLHINTVFTQYALNDRKHILCLSVGAWAAVYQKDFHLSISPSGSFLEWIIA